MRLITIVFLFNLIMTAHCEAMGVENKLQSLLDEFRKKSHAPAAVMSIKLLDKNKILDFTSGTVLKKSSSNPEPKKVTINNLFQIGSITKSFTAAIILQLEAEGKLSINDKIENTVQKYGSWLPEKEYLAWKKITIKQLLNMTSGIYDLVDDPEFQQQFLVKYPEKNWTDRELLAIAIKHKPYFAPGKGWHYSNTNYNIAGMLVEAITKKNIRDEMNQRLLEPLKLNDTYYLPFLYPKNIMKRMAHGYAYHGGDFSPPAIPGSDVTRINLSPAGASGAMVSNTHDIIRWVEAIFLDTILPKKQQQEMKEAVCMRTTPICKAGETVRAHAQTEGFALGLVTTYLSTLGRAWLYVGGTPGYYSAFLYFPQHKIILSMTVSASSYQSKQILVPLKNSAELILSSE